MGLTEDAGQHCGRVELLSVWPCRHTDVHRWLAIGPCHVLRCELYSYRPYCGGSVVVIARSCGSFRGDVS